jgi:hypothetical protein
LLTPPSPSAGPDAHLRSLYTPTSLAIDPATGNIYIADNQHQKIGMAAPAGALQTFAGGGSRTFLGTLPPGHLRLHI